MIRTFCSTALLMFVAVAVAPAQEKADIAWKFTKDKPFYQEMTTTTKQEMKVMGLEVKQTQEQTFWFTWTPLEEKDKAWTLEQKIIGTKIKITIAGNTVEFDSTNPGSQNNALSDFFKSLADSKFKVTLDKDKKVSGVDAGDFVKKLGSANPQMAPLLDKILSADALKQMADPTFGMVPKEPVAKGATWPRDAELNLGPIGTYKTNSTYTYEGQDEKNKDLAKIGVKTTLTYTPPAGGGEGLPFRIKSADLKSGSGSTGNILFDVKAGRLESSETTLDLTGEMTIEIGGMPSKVEIKQSQTTKIKTFEKNPIEKK